MWSVDFHGRYSQFNAQQRILFPVTNHSDVTKRQLARAMEYGTCTGIYLLNLADIAALHIVQSTLHSIYTTNQLLSRSNFLLIADTSLPCTAESLQESVRNILMHMKITRLDLLLLRADTLPKTKSIYERKCTVLQFWQQMIELKHAGLVEKIGVSDFSTQDIEFICTACPDDPPSTWSIEVTVPTGFIGSQITTTVTKSSSADILHTHFTRSVKFAHGFGIDVLVRFPFRQLEEIQQPVKDQWKRVTQTITQTHREKSFDVNITHEYSTEPFHTETLCMPSDSGVLDNPLQITMRYLLQKGLIVVPIASTSEEPGEVLNDNECRELFHFLPHPFTALGPSYSPHKLYSSILSREEMKSIEQTLQLGTH